MALPAQVGAQERELRQVRADIGATGIKIQNLFQEFAGDGAVQGLRTFDERFTDAEILFLLNDYQRASLVLLDLVDKKYRSEPRYRDAIYYLAEAQYQTGNDLAARDFFRRLIEGGEKDRLDQAVRRLIEIGDRTQRWEGLDTYVSTLRSQGRLPASIAYIQAKSLLRQGKYDDVLAMVGDMPSAHRMYVKARYLVAVATLQLGRLEESLKLFKELATASDRFDHAAEIRDLAALNSARIYLELGRLTEAADAYQQIERRSDHFEEALFETTWSYVRAAAAAKNDVVRESEYERALNALEIMLLSEAETTLAPEARLLLGNILLRLGRFEEATLAFDKVVRTYQPVRDELQRMASAVEDPSEYYDEIASRGQHGDGLLPPLALQWAAEQGTLKRALGVVDNLDQGDSWIEESTVILNKLLAVLNSQQRDQFFPRLREAQAQRREFSNALVGYTQRLIAVERSIVRSQLDKNQRDELKKILAQRAQVEPSYLALPRDQADYEAQRSGVERQLARLEKQNYQLRWAVEELKRTQSEIRKWLLANPDALGSEEEKGFRGRLDRQEAEIDALEKIRIDIQAEIDREKAVSSTITEAQSREDAIRRDYEATLEREESLLRSAQGLVDADDRVFLSEVIELQERVSSYQVELASFEERMDALVKSKSTDIKAQLLREQGLLTAHGNDIRRIRSDAKRVVGEIAHGSLEEVEEKFKRIVLRGDVGIVDVAWALKEEKTSDISKWVEEQRRELQTLESEFNDVLSEQ